MMEELICLCGNNTFKVCRIGGSVICCMCGEYHSIEELSKAMIQTEVIEEK
jgi:hypothetical protein